MKKIENIVLISFLFLLSFIPFLWLSKGQLILGYDAVFPLNPVAFLVDRIYSWTSVQGFAMDQSGIQGSLIIHFIDSVPYFLGFSAEYAQKIVFSFWFFAILFSAFIFIVRIEKSGFIESKYLRYFFPVLYTFNFYLLQGWWAIERTKFSLVVALPLIFSIILPMIKGKMSVWKVLKSAILCALILTVFNGGGWVGLPLYGGLFVMLGCYYGFFTFLFFLQRKIKEWVLMNLFFIFFLIWYLAFNAYTLLPFVSTTIESYGEIVNDAGGMAGLINWSKYINANASFVNLLRLQGIPDWYNNMFHPYSSIYINNPFFIFISFLIPFFIFASFFKRRSDYGIIIPFFLLTLLISGFFTAGTHPPLGFIFEFLMRFIPGFVVFRSAIFKFGYAYWFSVSFFISFLLSTISVFVIKKIKNELIKLSISISIPIVVVILILIYHFPFLTGDIFRIESTSISTRVNVPSYISEFSKWWQENGETDKILLLPRLNNDWLFEQYRWNYMSLFPITGNFANSNVIENAAILLGGEQNSVNDLYEAINSSNFEKIDYLTSALGIRYFLVRHDFYYDYLNQETDDPAEVERKLASNPKINHINDFGEWIVYRYSDQKPPITVHGNAVLISGKVTSDETYLLNKNSQLTLSQDVFAKFPEAFSAIIINPTCLNCSIERGDIQVTFPKPRILIDSNLYQLVELRDKLKIVKNETIEGKANRLIGNTLRLIGQVDQLIDQERNEYYLEVVKNKFLGIFKEISDIIPDIFTKSSNPYYYVTLIQQYLEQENSHLNNIVSSKLDRKEMFIPLEEILHSMQNLQDELKNYYDNSNYGNKIYEFSVVKEGNYTIKINKESFGILENFDFNNIFLSIDGEATRSGILDSSNVNFGNVFLEQGNHKINLTVTPQENIFLSLKPERITGKDCYSSLTSNFSYKKAYSLTFKSKNNFDPGFFFFIDQNNGFSPIQVNYIALAGEQIKNSKIIVSSQKMKLNKTVNEFRISFCALGLTEDVYKENIRNLSMVELISPQIILSQNLNKSEDVIPQVSFKEINQTHFKVHVGNANSPYLLTFNQKYASGWKIDVEGSHGIGDKFQNTWYINKTGSYDVNILYEPQKYFNIGLVVSTVALLTGSFMLWRFKKNV